jgi:hypothetical protein
MVVEITHNPDAWMVHLDDCGDALCGADPQHRSLSWIRHRVAVEGNDLKRVPRQSKAADFRRASVQDMEQNALAESTPPAK